MNAQINQPYRLSVLICAALALNLAACSHRSAAGDEEGGGKGNPEAVVAEVTLTRVGRAEISQLLAVTGGIAALPNQDVRVSAQVPGRIAEMKVAEGDRVAAGQLVAQIEDRPFRDQLQQAEAGAATARANWENAKLSRARNESLFSRGIAARKDLEDARTQESVAEAAVRQAEAALALARLQLTRCQVRSPLSGTVVKRFVSVGEQVDGSAAQPILEVANLNQVELFGNVPSVYLSKIHASQTLPISSGAFPGKTFTGRVVAISPAVDPATNSGLIRIRIANGNGLLRLGMFLNAQVPVETHARALVVPPQAIYRDQQGQPRVYRVEGENARAVPVQIGLESPERVELLSGVAEGETVILTGGYGLGEKAKVKVQGQDQGKP
jgi:RND family efflux transporter MFP subunit